MTVACVGCRAEDARHPAADTGDRAMGQKARIGGLMPGKHADVIPVHAAERPDEEG